MLSIIREVVSVVFFILFILFGLLCILKYYLSSLDFWKNNSVKCDWWVDGVASIVFLVLAVLVF